MSYKATNWAYELPLRGSAKPVLVALADMADEAGSCYPGQAKIAGMTGFSERTVRTALVELESLGLLNRVARYEGIRGRKSDRYVLSVGADLPAGTSGTDLIYRQIASDLPANNVRSTGRSCQGTTSEPLENNQIGELIEVEDIPDGTSKALALPDPFILTNEMKAWAAANTPGLAVAAVTADFVAYWRKGEGAGKKKKNWELTWRNNMKKQQSWLPASEQKPRKVKRF